MPDLKKIGLHSACGFLITIILLMDLSSPLGVAMGIPCIVIVLIYLWFSGTKKVVIVAGVCSFQPLGAFF